MQSFTTDGLQLMSYIGAIIVVLVILLISPVVYRRRNRLAQRARYHRQRRQLRKTAQVLARSAPAPMSRLSHPDDDPIAALDKWASGRPGKLL